MTMQSAATVVGLALGLASGAAAAATTTVDFTISQANVTVASGDFTYDSAKTGLLNFGDLSSFALQFATGTTYDLAYTLSGGFSQYYYLGYDASSKTFKPANIGGLPLDFGAIKADNTSGFALLMNGGVSSVADYKTNTTYEDVNFSYSVEMAAVPLPASAPLFGAALLALGAAGYAAKRKAAAA